MRQEKFAKKSLGQNFLTSTDVRDRILKEAGDIKGKTVLEIGPGLGFLTEPLLAAGANLTAVELDNRAVHILNKQFGNRPNFNLIAGDILQQNLDELFPGEPYCVIANIPYNITNPILRKLTEGTANQPSFVLLMVQKEVAEKICDPVAKTSALFEKAERSTDEDKKIDQPPAHLAGFFKAPLQGQPTAVDTNQKSKRSILSVAVEVYAQAKYCFTVDRKHFEPSPKVDSAIMRLDTRPEPLVPKEMQRDFFTVVNAGFSEKRKKIGNVLGKFFGIPTNKLLGNIDGNRRAETLTIEEWMVVTKNFRTFKDSAA